MKKVKVNKKVFFVTVPRSSDERFWNLVGKGDWEWDTYKVFDQFLDKEHSYIDIGAWIGPTVLYGCQIAKYCYAIEPNNIAFQTLTENINLNAGLRGKITLFNGCIGNVSGDMKLGTMTSFEDSMSSISFSQPISCLTVKSLTLEEFAEKNDIKDCNFIKMDIEGGESLVLPNMKAYLQKNKPTLFLSLHPFWFRNKEQDSKQIMNVLRMYNLYCTDGKRLKPDQLLNILLSLDNCNFSILATNDWNFSRRLLYVFKARLHHFAARWLKYRSRLFSKIRDW